MYHCQAKSLLVILPMSDLFYETNQFDNRPIYSLRIHYNSEYTENLTILQKGLLIIISNMKKRHLGILKS